MYDLGQIIELHWGSISCLQEVNELMHVEYLE